MTIILDKTFARIEKIRSEGFEAFGLDWNCIGLMNFILQRLSIRLS